MHYTVSAVIPTFNGQPLLEAHLPAVIKCLGPTDELIIVDDSSNDATVAWLTTTFGLKTRIEKAKYFTLESEVATRPAGPTIKLIVNKTNLRFGATVNRGVVLAQGDLILLLNNDVKPQADILTHLLPYFQSAAVFAVGCLEHEKDATGTWKKGGKNKLWFQRGMFIHARADDFKSGETAWVSGGSGVFDRQKWLELGGFDPLFYPAYWEDIDLSFRARQRGWQVVFESRAIVEHHHETTHQSVFGQDKIDAMSWRNANKFVWKNGSFWQKFQHVVWQPYWRLKKGSL